MSNQNTIVFHDSVEINFLVEFVLMYYLLLRNILSQCTHPFLGMYIFLQSKKHVLGCCEITLSFQRFSRRSLPFVFHPKISCSSYFCYQFLSAHRFPSKYSLSVMINIEPHVHVCRPWCQQTYCLSKMCGIPL